MVVCMNGFVIFDLEESADRFLRHDEIRQIRSRGHFVRSKREPLFTFRDLTANEVNHVRSLAVALGGRVKSSVRYSPVHASAD